MATVKLATLVIRTLAKPISTQIKNQAKQHERFREFCVSLAQRLYRSEVNLRTHILGEPAKHIRPLSETRAIENGANALAEGFLFTVAAALIIGETWRTSRNQSKRRDNVDEKLEDLGTRLRELATQVDGFAAQWEDRLREESERNDEIARILERVVQIGLQSSWGELHGTPLQFPNIQVLAPRHKPQTHSSDTPDDSDTRSADPPPSQSPPKTSTA